jgi:hypothetical protein
MLYPLEASDDFGLEGLPDRERLLAWLDSWLQDPDAKTCQLEKLEDFTAASYLSEVES